MEKPIIAMLHLEPLPGDPEWRPESRMERVVELARQDLRALQDGGVDAVLVSNEFSLPYQRHMSFVTPAAMALSSIRSASGSSIFPSAVTGNRMQPNPSSDVSIPGFSSFLFSIFLSSSF